VITAMQLKMDPIVDTVLDIISKCVVAAVRPGQEAESTIAGDLHQISQRSQDVDEEVCGICLSKLFECTGEDVDVMSLREMKCPGTHQFHSQCLRKWLVHSKRGDCPMCRHNFYDAVREDCAANLEHQVQPCPIAGFKCFWSTTYNRRVAAVKILIFCKSSSDLPFGENVASALLWSLSESHDNFDDLSELVNDQMLSEAIEVLNPHLVWQYCVSLVKAFNVAETHSKDMFDIVHAMRMVSGNEDCCTTLVSLGCFSILLNMDSCDANEMVEVTIVNFLLHEELGPGLLIELLEAYKAAETGDVRERFANIISDIASKNEEGHIAFLISGGACTALIEDLKISNDECDHALQKSKNINLYLDMHYGSITSAILNIASTHYNGCSALVEAGACDALIAAVRVLMRNFGYVQIIDTLKLSCNILRVVNSISGRYGNTLVAADCCPVLIAVLKNTKSVIERYPVPKAPDFRLAAFHQIQEITAILRRLVQIKEGREELIKADAYGVLLEILKNPDVVLKDEHINNITYFMFRIFCSNCGLLMNPIVEGLRDTNNDCIRSRLSIVIADLYVGYGVGNISVYLNPAHFVSAGTCGALLQAFKTAESDSTRNIVVGVIDTLSRKLKESRVGFVVAGALGVLKDSLKCCEQGVCGSTGCAIAEIISLLGDPESSAAATGDDPPVKKRNTSDDI
jgi:hypothetical protein